MSDEYGHKMRGAFAAFNHLRYFFGYLGLNGRSGLFSVEYVHLYEVQNRKFKGFWKPLGLEPLVRISVRLRR